MLVVIDGIQYIPFVDVAPPNDGETLGDYLIRLRTARKLSIHVVAKYLLVSPTGYLYYEANARQKMPLELAVKIARLYKLDMNNFMQFYPLIKI